MLGQRASRLVSTLRGNQTPDPAAASCAASLSPEQRIARWKSIAIKMMMVLNLFALKQRTRLFLGKAAFARIFTEIRDRATRPFQASRIINGEVVGPPMDPMEGTPSVDRATCQHPVHQMSLKGSNQYKKCFTCKDCLSRWQRLKLSDIIPTGTPTHEEQILFGSRYVGETFTNVYSQDPAYSTWVLGAVEHQEETSTSARRFAQYVVSRESRESREAEVTPPTTPVYPMTDMETSDEDQYLRVIYHTP